MTAKSKLRTDEFLEFFKTFDNITTKNISDFYLKNEPNIKQTTINWRVYTLVQMGVVARIGHGSFVVTSLQKYQPTLGAEIKDIATSIKENYPFLKYCIWNTVILNEFMHHQIGQFYLIIEVEPDAAMSVFYFLQEAKYPVFFMPTSNMLAMYSPNEKNAVIVKGLVSEAPTQEIDNIVTISIEKILIDIFCDTSLFVAQQGIEMQRIFTSIFEKYVINKDTLFRYAQRRGKKNHLYAFLNKINLFNYSNKNK